MQISKQETYIFAKTIQKFTFANTNQVIIIIIFVEQTHSYQKLVANRIFERYPNRLIIVFTFTVCVQNLSNHIILDHFNSHSTHLRTYTKCKLSKFCFKIFLKHEFTGYICDRTMKSVKIIRKFDKNVLFCEKIKLFFKAICGEQVLKT